MAAASYMSMTLGSPGGSVEVFGPPSPFYTTGARPKEFSRTPPVPPLA